MPTASGHLFALIRLVNRLLNRGELDADQVQQVLDFVRHANQILAVIDFEAAAPGKSDPQIEQRIDARNQARRDSDFARADAIRDELRSLGVQLIDGPEGTRWQRMKESSHANAD